MAKILIAPMDWGLGHTTRCIPIAQHFHKLGHTIFFAGNNIQQQLFEASCPFATSIFLDGYNVKYPSKGSLFMLKMVMQLPKIATTIKQEHTWLRQQMRMHHFDIILSDNRYGLYHEDAKNILITHQLNIQTGTRLGNWVIKEKTKKLINHFQECWLVDAEECNLASYLSEHIALKIPTRNIGWLSQFQYNQEETAHPLDGKPYILAVLSGPEPMRTQFQKSLLGQMAKMPELQFVMISGMQQTIPQHANNIHFITLADQFVLKQYMQHCSGIICRSGYSSIMDIICLQKPAFFVPTPGQTEQEILAEHLSGLAQFNFAHQDAFRLDKIVWSKATLPYYSYLPKEI